MNHVSALVGCALYVTAFGSARADVIWNPSAIEIKATASNAASGVVHFSFNFENTGSSEIIFNKPTASCGCTIATFANYAFQKGEKGELTGTFNTAGKWGLNKVSIKIDGNQLVDGKLMPFHDTLAVSILVPEIIKISPPLLLWVHDKERSLSKKAKITIVDAELRDLRFASISNSDFDFHLDKTDESGVYLVTAKIVREGATSAVATILGTTSSGKELRFYMHLASK